jgi:hypothetical protein
LLKLQEIRDHKDRLDHQVTQDQLVRLDRQDQPLRYLVHLEQQDQRVQQDHLVLPDLLVRLVQRMST